MADKRQKIILLLIVFLGFSLRVFKLGQIPPSLYWDEASLGYNAFSIATTLHDEHGEFLPLTRFIAFGDYKPPGYIYATAMAVKLLGLSEFTIRLPSALAGTGLVLIAYFLVRELFMSISFRDKLSLLAALLLAVSPWSLQMSRGAFEANLATLFSSAGVLAFLYAVRLKNILGFVFSALGFALSMYTFNSHRIFTPLLAGLLVAVSANKLWNYKRGIVVFLTLSFLLVLPLIFYFPSREARLRFDEVSWINDLAIIELSNQRIADDNNTLISRIIHNRRLGYVYEFLKHYFDNFNPAYLFFNGDANPRLSIQSVGQFYLIELPFLLAGIFYLIKQDCRGGRFILISWALLALVPASLARETPHALRTLNILPVPHIIIALGIIAVRSWWKKQKLKRIFIPLLLIFYFLSAILYFNEYYFVYQGKYSLSWQDGYRQLVAYVAKNKSNYDKISVTAYYGRPYIYFLLYNQYDVKEYWKTRRISRDWYGFWYVHSFDKYIFDETLPLEGKILYAVKSGERKDNARLVEVIRDISGKPVFELWESY